MNKYVSGLLAEMQAGEVQSFKNLTVIPFFFRNGNKLGYVTLDEALGRNLIEIKEVSEGGSVPELFVDNKSKERVFLLDGEELEGAKQNRVLNASILLEKQSKTVIPVSCVEERRWNYRKKTFGSSGSSMSSYSKMNKMSSVSRSLSASKGKSYSSDQGEVWREVDRVSSSARVSSPTKALSDVYQQRKNDLEEYLKNIKIIDPQNGFMVFINERPAGMEYISNEKSFSLLFKKILKGYAMEALIDPKESVGADFEKMRYEFAESLKRGDEKVYKSVGLGNDHRMDSETIAASALIVEDELVHFAALSSRIQGSEFKTKDFVRRIRD